MATRGRNGGYQLRDGWRTQLTGLTPGEARALFLAGLPGPAKALGIGEAAASAHLKLVAALPGDWQADAQRVGSCFHLDPVDWFRDAAPVDHLRDVAHAVWNEQRLRMRYESWTEVAEREIEPLGLVLKAGAWYVVGRRGRVARTYKLDEHARGAVARCSASSGRAHSTWRPTGPRPRSVSRKACTATSRRCARRPPA